jgi:hypothetical protein
MAIEIGGRRYETIIGTAQLKPGFGAFIEMRELDTPDLATFLFAFRLHSTGKVTVSMYRQDVPFEVVAYFLRVASEELSTERWPLSEDAP